MSLNFNWHCCNLKLDVWPTPKMGKFKCFSEDQWNLKATSQIRSNANPKCGMFGSQGETPCDFQFEFPFWELWLN